MDVNNAKQDIYGVIIKMQELIIHSVKLKDQILIVWQLILTVFVNIVKMVIL